MRSLARARTLGALAAAVYLAAGCNAVLGIEQAEVAESTAPSLAVCNASQGTQLAACSPAGGVQTTCELCIAAKCKDVPSAALTNADYRIALASYRSCQRTECTDDGSCATCLSAEPSAACVAGCAKECQTAEVIQWCDAYCTCMGQNCPSPTYHLGTSVVSGGATDDANCRTKCMAEDVWRVNCLLTHCELAAITKSQGHCRHADDTLVACSKDPPPASACTSHTQRQLGYPCSADNECCSGNCKDKPANGTCSQ